MVLKNSKYDKQAKKQYMRKHGLIPPPTEKIVRPKWSLKAKTDNKEMLKLDIDEMTSDWDSEVDEDIVNYFYPSIGETLVDMPLDLKRKVKRQVIEDLKLQRDELFNQDLQTLQNEAQEREQSGIFLGDASQANNSVKLTEFIPQIPITKRKIRKLPINDDDTNLNDYGISVSDTLTNNDYDEIYKQKLADRRLDQILSDELIGFKVGKDLLSNVKTNKKSNVQYLNDVEKQQDDQFRLKTEQQKFYNDIKNKFGKQKTTKKVIELNNLDNSNPDHVNFVNSKLVDKEESTLDEDLDALLGTNFSAMKLERDSLDAIPELTHQPPSISSLPPQNEPPSKHDTKSINHNDFLDELLG